MGAPCKLDEIYTSSFFFTLRGAFPPDVSLYNGKITLASEASTYMTQCSYLQTSPSCTFGSSSLFRASIKKSPSASILLFLHSLREPRWLIELHSLSSIPRSEVHHLQLQCMHQHLFFTEPPTLDDFICSSHISFGLPPWSRTIPSKMTLLAQLKPSDLLLLSFLANF